MKGYYRFPNMYGKRIVFVSEDNLWLTDETGRRTERLTNNKGFVYYPFFSPDGKNIAYSANEEGIIEIYIIPSTGGTFRRLTYLNSISYVVGWKDKDHIIFRSNYRGFNRRFFSLFTVNIKNNKITPLPYGLAHQIDFEKNGKGIVIGKNTGDPARWKRYRGGTAGQILIDKTGNFQFKKLINFNTNLSNPMWIGERIYFISDHEGNGNIYSTNVEGKDIKKHTNFSDYYVRHASKDKNGNIVFQKGGDLFILNTKNKKVHKINIEYHSPKVYIQRKFVTAGDYLEDFFPSFDAKRIVFSARGHVFGMGNFEGPVYKFGDKNDARYRLPKFLPEDKEVILITDEDFEERIAIYPYGENKKKIFLKDLDIGRVVSYRVSPKEKKIVLLNHRQELLLVDIKKKEKTLIFKDKYATIGNFDWSPDGKFIVFNGGISTRRTALFIYSLKDKKIHQITDPIYHDGIPVFSKDGKYIFFTSMREFNPVMDSAQFEISFPKADGIYGICLRKDTLPITEYTEEKKNKNEKKNKDKKDEEKIDVKIDFNGIKERIFKLPIPIGIYGDLECTEKKLFILSYPLLGEDENIQGMIYTFDLKEKKFKRFYGKCDYFYVAEKYIFIRSDNHIKRLSIEHSEDHSDDSDEKTTININRASVLVEPLKEWKQMYKEAWRLQRDNFWNEKMSGIDWENVYKKYYKLLDRLGSRSEFSDLIWEMQGELGTSHCYEYGGDYHKVPHYTVGKLGGEFKWNGEKKGYEIIKIFKGDVWNEVYKSPLQTPGLNIDKGDIIKAIDGEQVNKNIPMEQMLLNKAAKTVKLTIEKKNGNKKDVYVKTIGSEANVLYREWIEKNREYVNKKTKGKIGYIHIPDMGLFGYSEFHRYYLGEIEKEGIIVDVRFNGGGFVSQLILEKLSRKVIGYDFRRWGTPEPYPSDSVRGPIAIITNEHAGSDGDIFSHSSKLLKIGKLIGTRTWGGVIGIWPRHALSDGTITTQPEFSFWFKDVGWHVENYGTDPDIEVDIMPKDYKNGKDPQLDTAIKEVLKELKNNKKSPKIPKLPQWNSRK